ncbi:hypothetical protein HAX54_000789, partial [Datura stramonium]|nr:hypothetical protein [Datura stramonium]
DSKLEETVDFKALDDEGHDVKFGKRAVWKVIKGNLVIARGKKQSLLYMIYLLPKGVTGPVSKEKQNPVYRVSGVIAVHFAEINPEPQ